MSNRQQLGSIKRLKLHTHIHFTAYHKLISTMMLFYLTTVSNIS